MRAKTFLIGGILAVAVMAVSARQADAVPILQLYVEGGTYDSATETWVVTATDPVRVWAIGNVAGPGGKGSILDVKMAISYEAGLNPLLTVTSSTTGGYGGFVDPSTPQTATLIQTVTDGSTPILGDGDPLPNHGQFGSGTWWQEFSLGDFTLTDSPMADFINAFPTAPATTSGQINVYTISTGGFTGTLHFDLYDHYYAQNGLVAKFAPFSHDAEMNPVPEPGTFALVGSAVVALVARRRRQQQKSKKA